MRFLADLHVHSPFSLATSKEMTFDTVAAWAKIKGLALVGTGDFTHPGMEPPDRRDSSPPETLSG